MKERQPQCYVYDPSFPYHITQWEAADWDSLVVYSSVIAVYWLEANSQICLMAFPEIITLEKESFSYSSSSTAASILFEFLSLSCFVVQFLFCPLSSLSPTSPPPLLLLLSVTLSFPPPHPPPSHWPPWRKQRRSDWRCAVVPVVLDCGDGSRVVLCNWPH